MSPKAKAEDMGTYQDKGKGVSKNKSKTQKANTPASRKSKGRALQNKIRDLLVAELGIPREDIFSRSMGASGSDIVLSSEARSTFTWTIVCKCQEESLNIWTALEQAKSNANIEDLRPLLIFKRNHSKTYATLELEDFINLVVVAQEHTKILNSQKSKPEYSTPYTPELRAKFVATERGEYQNEPEPEPAKGPYKLPLELVAQWNAEVAPTAKPPRH